MVCFKIKSKRELTARDKRELSQHFRAMFTGYDLEYVFLCDDKKQD